MGKFEQSSKCYEYQIKDQNGIQKTLISEQPLFLNANSDSILLSEITPNNKNLNSEDVNIDVYRIAEYQIAEQAHIAEDMTSFFSEIHQIIKSLTDAEDFFIALYDEGNQSLSVPYIVDTVSNITAKDVANLPIEKVNKTLTGYMLRSGKMLHANAALMKMLEEQGETSDIGAISNDWLGFPLKKSKKLLGALVIQTYDPERFYGPKDIDLMQFVSQQVATALARKQSEEALKVSEKRLSDILRNSSDLIYKLNLATEKYEFVSQSAESILGYTSEECLAMDLRTLRANIHDDDRERSTEEFKSAISRYSLDHQVIIPLAEYRWLHKDGTYHWYTDNRTIICNDENIAIAVIGSIRDISAEKESEAQLKDTEAELHKMQELENIGVLAGGLAHDFNNILTGIFGNLAISKMKMSKEHPSYKNLIKAEQSIDRATRLTGQLLTFAKGGEPIKEDVDLIALIEETAIFDLTGSNVRAVFDFRDKQLAINGDKGQIQQLISNLVINADQAMPDGGQLHVDLSKVTLSTNQVLELPQGKYIKIEIKDQGRGIDEETLIHIFDPYFSTKEKGSGLGLTTVYSIIKKHAGHISVSSMINKGTTFTIYLPAIEILTSKIDDTIEKSPDLHLNKKILVMDDDEMILSLLTSILELNNIDVMTVVDGNEAIRVYQQAQQENKPFDVVIMDLTIPGGMGGKDAIIEILKIDSKARCIVSSGYADDPIMANFADYGFKSAVAKPFVMADLMASINDVLT